MVPGASLLNLKEIIYLHVKEFILNGTKGLTKGPTKLLI